MPEKSIFRALLPGLLLLLAACVTDPVLEQTRQDLLAGRGEQALARLETAMKDAPQNLTYRTEYHRQRELLVAQWLSQADTLRTSGHLELAETLYRRVLGVDPNQPRARMGLAAVATEKRHREALATAERLYKEGKYGAAQDLVRPVLIENPEQRGAQRLQRLLDEKLAKPKVVTPQLKTVSRKPVLLELREVPLRQIFEVIARAGGLSIVLDKDVRADQRTTIMVRDTTVEDLIRLVLTTNQLDMKVVNETTLIVFPNTPQKQREYQELVVRTFYLTNADAKQIASMIRALVKTRDLYIDEKLNAVTIKDTPNAIRLVERLITTHDHAEPEVMLEVEVLEVGYNRLQEVGLRFPESLAFGLVGAAGVPGVLSLPEWLNRGSELVQLTFTNPLFLATLRQRDGTTSVLANPRIRVRNKERARVHIGDRVPVLTTTAAATGGFVSESVSYLDVGLKLEVEPAVTLDDEVGIRVGLEVSNIVREVRSTGTGTLTYQIGTRNAATALRLKDGETQILAGLISDEDRRTANRVPGIGDLPVIGRLFSSTSDTLTKSEIVLLITPRIVRQIPRSHPQDLEVPVGTEPMVGSGSAGVGPGTATRFIQTVPPPDPVQTRPPEPKPALIPFGGVQPAPSSILPPGPPSSPTPQPAPTPQ